MIILLLSLLSLATMAEEFVVEKTYPRGNTHCGIHKKRIHFQIRGLTKFTLDTKEKDFGEYVFYVNDKKHNLLPINKDRMDSFQFIKGKSTHCSKTLGYMLNDSTLAVLFFKENKPFPGKLTIQLFDAKKVLPGEVIESNYMTNTKIIAFKNGFAFPSLPEVLDVENGKVTIENTSYLYQNRSITPWISYSLKGFETQPSLTYSKSIWKRFFKTEKDFLVAFEWNQEEKQFKKTVLYTAFNHGAKKKCILPVSGRQQLTGMENWICR